MKLEARERGSPLPNETYVPITGLSSYGSMERLYAERCRMEFGRSAIKCTACAGRTGVQLPISIACGSETRKNYVQ